MVEVGGAENASGESLPSETQQKSLGHQVNMLADQTSIGFMIMMPMTEIRVIRDDLEGSFNAQVQFGQSQYCKPKW